MRKVSEVMDHPEFDKLKALPIDGKAVTLWRTHDEAFLDVVKGIKRAIRDLQNGTTYPQNTVANVSLEQSKNQSIPSVTQPAPTSIVYNQIGSITGNNHSIIQAENQYTTNNYYGSPEVQKRDKRDKIQKSLKDIENAIVRGNYYSAYHDVVSLSKQADEEMPIQEAARLKYLEALIHLNGKRPCKQSPSVMKQAEAALQDACRLHNLSSYKKILALLKQDFARSGVQVKKNKDEAYKLSSQANRLPVKQEDREVIALFSRCHPQLSQEYSHLLSI